MVDDKEETKEAPVEEQPKQEEAPKVEEKKEEKSTTESLTQVADRLEAANKKTEELVKRQEELGARRLLGGQSEGTVEEEKKEQTPKEYIESLGLGKKF